jgi:tetratricopeptide (TPR) repeat protein
VRLLLRYAWGILAFCTVTALLPLRAAALPGTAETSGHLDAYKERELSLGASQLPVVAQVLYRQALAALENGKRQEARDLLLRAIQLNPEYPDAYFTLARLSWSNLNGEALFFLARAFVSLSRSFHYQSLLAVNGILFAMLLLIFLSSIVGIAFVIKYLPFSAHKLREFLQSRFDAAHGTIAAYLLLLLPFALFPGFITGFAIMIIITWFYLDRREKAVVLLLAAMLIGIGFSANTVKRLTPAADPASLTSIIARGNTSSGNPVLIRTLKQAPAGHPEMKLNKNLSLGLLHLKRGDLLSASDYLLRAISSSSQNAVAYIDLGNTYYLQGEYEKALEGYIKAEAIDSLNAVGQYNLAQAYIKTLLLGRSSDALNRATAAGIDAVKESYAVEALRNVQVFPATLSNRELWNLALIEGALSKENFMLDTFITLTNFPPLVSSWILIVAFIAALLAGTFAKSWWLTFPCANCGTLTCNGCCNDDRSMVMCQDCAKTIDGISSDKVVDALLRQRRQTMVAKRRKAARFLVCWIPGVKHIHNGGLFGGLCLALLFAASVLALWSRGLLIKDWDTISYSMRAWKIVLPAALIALAYAGSIRSKQTLRMTGFSPTARRDLRQGAKREEQPRRKAAL